MDTDKRRLVMAYLSLRTGFDMLDMDVLAGKLSEQEVMDILVSIDLIEEWKNV